MKKIKDLIYDYNDVFVALLIVALAACVITWRIDRVMAYSDYVSSNTTEQKQIDSNFDDVDLNPEDVDDITEASEDAEGQTKTETSTENEKTNTADPSTEKQNEETSESEKNTDPVVETKTYKLSISKESGINTWGAVGKWMEQNGLAETSKIFVNRVVERKLDTRLQLGDFEFTSDMTMDEIIDILTK